MVENGNVSSAVVTTVARQFDIYGFLGQVAFNLGSCLTGLVLGRKLKRC